MSFNDFSFLLFERLRPQFQSSARQSNNDFFFHWCSSIHVKDLTKKAVLLVVHDNLEKLHPVKFQMLLVYFGKLLRVPPTQFSTWRYTKLGLNDNWKFLKLSHFMIHQILSRASNLICLSTCSEAVEDKKKKTCLGSCLRTLSSTTLILYHLAFHKLFVSKNTFCLRKNTREFT